MIFFSLIKQNQIWKVANIAMYCDTRTDVYTYTQIHRQKKKYIYNNSHINNYYSNDNKNQRFYTINLVHITPIGITYYNTNNKAKGISH